MDGHDRHGSGATHPSAWDRGASRVGVSTPQQLGRYVILHRIGAGMMGVVYAAYDPHLDRKVAIKLLHERKSGSGAEEAQQRLVREARSMARLSHPNVVQIYDSGFVTRGESEEVFLAMEYVQGRDLEEWLAELKAQTPASTLRWQQIVQVFLQAARGLAAAHAAGVVHRDFKPTNVLVTTDGEAKVGDFGLARLPSEPDVARKPTTEELELDLTATGDVLGTPAYMSPEQHEGLAADARSDQFALCVALYEALYEESPFLGDTYAARAMSVVEGELRPIPTDRRVPAQFGQVLKRGLSHDPDERFASMDAFVAALHAAGSPRKRTVGLIAGGALAAAAIAAVTLAGRPGPCSGAAEELAGVWDATVRQRVQAALSATKIAYAEPVRDQILGRLDAYAGAWAAAHQRACEATNVRKVQSRELLDRRMACLESRRVELGAFVAELSQPDEQVVRGAVPAAADLPGLEPCADLSALTDQVPLPSGAETTRAVAALRATLAEARGQARAGRYEEGLRAVQTASVAWGQRRYEPAASELALTRGLVLAALSRHREAQSALRQAFLRALRAQHQSVAAEASAALVPLVGVELGQHEVGLVWADVAEATLVQHGPRPKERAALDGARARVLSAQGDREAAMAAARRALAHLEQSGLDDPYALGQAELHLGSTLVDIRDYQAAAPILAQAVLHLEAALGPEHPELVGPLTWLGRARQGIGDWDNGLVVLERAIALADRHLGPDHPARAQALMRRASLRTRLNQHDLAIADYREALRVLVLVYGEQHTLVARAWLNLGATHQRLGQLEEAERNYRTALQIRESILGPNHPDLVLILQNMNSLAVEGGRSADAIAGLTRALHIRETTLSAPGAIADVQYWLGRALYESGEDRARGRSLVEQAHATFVTEDLMPQKDTRDWLRAQGFDPRPAAPR